MNLLFSRIGFLIFAVGLFWAVDPAGADAGIKHFSGVQTIRVVNRFGQNIWLTDFQNQLSTEVLLKPGQEFALHAVILTAATAAYPTAFFNDLIPTDIEGVDLRNTGEPFYMWFPDYGGLDAILMIKFGQAGARPRTVRVRLAETWKERKFPEAEHRIVIPAHFLAGVPIHTLGP